jgi:thermolysin metallopeptidase-like protein
VAKSRFLAGSWRCAAVVRLAGVVVFPACAAIVALTPMPARAITRQVYDCGDPFGDTTCYLDAANGGHIYGRSEGQPPRGANPNHLVFFNGRDVFGSTDVDTLYDMMGQMHPYFSTKFGRNGPNSLGGTGNGTSIPHNVTRILAHVDGWTFGPQACGGPVNAFEGGGLVGVCMGSTQKDLIGHELSHSILEYMRQNPNGTWVSIETMNEPGTLNEAMSDFFGEGIERFLTGDNDWLFTIYPDGVTVARDMADPPSQSQSILQHPPDRYLSPDFYTGTFDSGGVHLNAGVLNKASYLAVEGGSFNGFTIAGIGFDKVEQIWYRAITQYFESDETFNEAYEDLVQAATDLYGPEDVWEVTKALRSVEMHLSREGLNGDFNLDGFVDAADYVMLQKQIGTFYTIGALEFWRNHFRDMPPGGGSSDANVPEPMAVTMAIAAGAFVCAGGRRRR